MWLRLIREVYFYLCTVHSLSLVNISKHAHNAKTSTSSSFCKQNRKCPHRFVIIERPTCPLRFLPLHVFPQCNIARVAEKTGEACHLSLPDVVKNKFLMFFCWLGRICDCISGTLIFQTTLIKQRGEKSERPFAL